MSALRPTRMIAESAVSIRAWRVSPDNPRGEAEKMDLSAFSVPTALAAAQIIARRPKDMLFVQVRDDAHRPERRFTLYTYLVRQKAARWVRGPRGEAVKETPLYPDLIGRVCLADSFAPVTPADVLADPVGLDRTLVEGKAA